MPCSTIENPRERIKNVVGGFMVTNRMLAMFKKKD